MLGSNIWKEKAYELYLEWEKIGSVTDEFYSFKNSNPELNKSFSEVFDGSIIRNNPCDYLGEECRFRMKNLFKGYKNLIGAMRQELQRLGVEITEHGKHNKLTYRGDSRYMVTVG